MPPASRVYFGYTEWLTLMQTALWTWTSLTDTLPQDVISDIPNAVTGNFTCEWKTQEEIFSATGHMWAATTGTAFQDSRYPCRITHTLMWFALDPQTIQGTPAYWGTNGVGACAPYCGTYDIDFLSAAVHEYGHALGLDHTLAITSTMYPRQTPNDSISRTLSACDIDIVRSIYRDNCGPAVVDSFVVNLGPGNTALCRWQVRQETGCRQYVIRKSLEDGTTWTVVDSIECLGVSTHAVTDPAPAAGMSLYVLSVVDSVGPEVWQESALAEQTLSVTGSVPSFARHVNRDALIDPEPGFATPEEAVRAFGVALSSRNDGDRRRAMADGFTYYTIEQDLFWGMAIDRILDEGLRECLASADSSIDSLAIDVQAAQYVSENVAHVMAATRFVYRCRTAETDWAGQILAVVERRRPDDGWRVRQITELW